MPRKDGIDHCESHAQSSGASEKALSDLIHWKKPVGSGFGEKRNGSGMCP
jgi:hypothetical protein